MTKINLLSFLIIYSSYSLACRVQSPPNINLAFSPLEEQSVSYSNNKINKDLPILSINSCQNSAESKKYIMIASGPEVVEQSDQMRGINFNKIFVESRCLIKDSPLKKSLSNEEYKSEFHKKWKYLNECIQYQITEFGSKPLSYPADQEGCQIVGINSKSALFSGGYCFFKPSSDSSYKVEFKINKSCEKLSGYKNKNINLQELNGGLSFYLSSQYKGDLYDLDAIESVNLHLSTNPISPLIKPSDDFGIIRPLFPADYILNDVHLGKIEIYKVLSNFIRIKTPFIVSNICKESEYEGIKSSNCDYSSPISAEIILTNDKNEEIARWYDGGISPPQWQGIINGDGILLREDQIITDQKYHLEFVFSDPYFDFNSLKKQFRSRIDKIRILSPDHNSRVGIDTTPDLPDLSKMPEEIILDDLNGKASIGEARRKLSEQFSSTIFPPIYDSICKQDSKKCEKISKNYLTFIASFVVSKNYTIENLNIKRASNILESYQKDINHQPEFSCK
jgi:hypothetical protein